MEIRKMELREGGYAIAVDDTLVELECTQTNGAQGKFIVIATLDTLAESLLVWSRIVNAARALRDVSVLEDIPARPAGQQQPVTGAGVLTPTAPVIAQAPPAPQHRIDAVRYAVAALAPEDRLNWARAVLQNPPGFEAGSYELALEVLTTAQG